MTQDYKKEFAEILEKAIKIAIFLEANGIDQMVYTVGRGSHFYVSAGCVEIKEQIPGVADWHWEEGRLVVDNCPEGFFPVLMPNGIKGLERKI